MKIKIEDQLGYYSLSNALLEKTLKKFENKTLEDY